MMYAGLYMDAMFLLECINTSLYLCTGSRQIVVPFKKCMSPQSTINYWAKLNIIVMIPFAIIYVIQVVVAIYHFPITASVLGWVSNMIIVYINVLELVATYKFHKYVLDSVFKHISILQILLTIVNASTLFISNFWFAITDLVSYFKVIDFDLSLMYKNIVYSIGSITQGILIIQLNNQIQKSIKNSAEMFTTEIYT
ncbi:Hypothetical_protein [Hexamita inflata]|uniref:Hypothetical_protein n=1 Tax=Hexamita inflata TaxID=28002 RepID=A0ABP1HGX4_9EUKA